jgi:hypothetical protein
MTGSWENNMFLWLDDIRNPFHHGAIGAVWAKTYEEAIELLQSGEVTIASLDHDLNMDQTMGVDNKEHTGYDVLVWMELNDVWPINGVQVHSQNPSGRIRMLQVVQKHYGKLFQPPFYI